MRTLSERKSRFKHFLNKRRSLRLHMFFILTATILVGLITSKVLLSFYFYNMAIRYAITILFSYLMFFGFMKLWLLFLASSRKNRQFWGDRTGDAVDVLSNDPEIPSKSELPTSRPFRPGGGHFGGGGTSGSFESSAEIIHQTSSEAIASTASETAAVVGEGAAGSAGEAVASSIFEGGGIVLIILGLVLSLVCGAGIYIIYEAPAILSETAFEFLLAASLMKKMKKMEETDWVGSVVRATFLPFIFTLFIAICFALVVQGSYPQTTKLSDLFRL